ncbi:Glycosyltransferase [Roseibium alexandrii DFL-11]|uniref:Glycosyltransferase n=2 Tax=Roseibium alexandrii TaxID=388408 RepID=A0A5E8GUY8_ROSAD|nr:Glycosyltransferase [Roseibium alexandrii DFL-11]
MPDNGAIGYILNTYPVPSATFIRREIHALEDIGFKVTPFACRRFAGDLVDPKDRIEAARTEYLLDGKLADLLLASIRELLTNITGVWRTLPIWKQLLSNAGGGFVRHVAYLMQAASLRQKASRAGIRHLHAHFGTNATAIAMLAHSLGGPNYSFTAHGPNEFENPAAQSFALKIQNATFVLAISDYCKNLLTSFTQGAEDIEKIHIARCGIELADYSPQPPVSATNNTFVCVGRLCPEKGQVHIPAAVSALKADFPDIKVILVGDGESRADVEAAIKKHAVEDYVILHGWGSNSEVQDFIKSSRALVLPSYAEGLPIVLMESLALARPVITTTIAGIPELVDVSCGWLVPPGDVGALTEALRSALSKQPAELKRMGEAGRERVAAMHDIRNLARAFDDQIARTTSQGSRQQQADAETVSSHRGADPAFDTRRVE